jgi:ornithine cyclodeaminase/alanine dehydrogenase-like protein (mu-crystallin family)
MSAAGMELRILNADEVRQALSMAEAIAGMKAAFAQLSGGRAEVPLRTRVAVPAHQGVSIFMPAYLTGSEDLAVKIVSVFPGNARRGEPITYGLVVVLDAGSGRPLALLEGGALTAIRTGAASGAATDLLARAEASVAAVIGCGVQARTQLEAVCTVRAIREVRVYGLNRPQAETFAAEMAGKAPIPAAIRVVDGPQAAVAEADVICTATTSSTPVFDGRDLKPGAHVNAVGAYTPQMQEVDAETIRRSLLVVDSRPAVLAEAGDLIIPLQAGEIAESHIHAELGEIVLGSRPGRSHPDQITTFKSVGVAVQDAAAARIALAGAARHNLGTLVDL